MSILVRFLPTPGVTREQYDEAVRRLEQMGDFPPDGLEYHVAFMSEGALAVSEIWDSPEQLEAFGQRLRPVLEEVGIDLEGEPQILEVINTVKR